MMRETKLADVDRITTLRRFFAQYRLLANSTTYESGNWEALKTFFQQFAELKSQQPTYRATVLRVQSEPADLDKVFKEYAKLASHSRREGDFIRFWGLAGLGQVELRNAAVLAWLLNPNETHGRGSAIFRALVRELAVCWEGNPPLAEQDIDNYFVLSEH